MSQVLRLDLPVKPACAGQRGDQRVLHDVLRRVAVAQLQLRHAQQVAAMRLDLGGERGGVHGARKRRGNRADRASRRRRMRQLAPCYRRRRGAQSRPGRGPVHDWRLGAAPVDRPSRAPWRESPIAWILAASLRLPWRSLVAAACAASPPGAAPRRRRAAAGPPPAPLPQDQLDALLAPIALYPDQLLAQVLMASTYPLEVVEAARFVKANRDLKGDALEDALKDKTWDPSVQVADRVPAGAGR